MTTGGTAGLALLLAPRLGWSFSVLFVVVSLPFVVLAVRGKGWAFTARSAVAVALVSGFSALQPHLLGVATIGPLYAAVVGNLLAGIGILVVFRHRSSLGGFNVVALLCQERLGWRAGYVQMALDVGRGARLRRGQPRPGADPGLRRRCRAAQPRHRDEPPPRALHRRLSATAP